MATPFSQSSSFGTSDSTSGAAFTPQQQGVRNQLFPFGQNRLNQLAGQGGPSALDQNFWGQGQSQFPTIHQGGVLTPQQVKEGTAQIYSQGQSQAAGADLATANKFAGANEGANSEASLWNQTQNDTLSRALTQRNAVDFGLSAAEKNAQADIQRQSLQIQSAAGQGQQDSARRALALQNY